ncbi:MAG TPA: type II secretion system protein [Geobacteraceae bacterium]|nr:type II secretion system protein [Geobacteraceae bacterium]
MFRLLTSKGGFTYIAALVIVVVMGIMLGAVGQSMRIVMQREREKELIFRGLQYRDAIERWTRKGPMPLKDIKDLLKDPRSAAGERLIRRLYMDPMTGKEMKVLSDPNLGIYGVASTSNDEPLKKANFPDILKSFEEKKKYSEWEFIYKRQVSAPVGSQRGQQGQQQQQGQPSLPLSTPEGP